MIDKNLLEEMSRVTVHDAGPACLRDILEIEIHGETAGQRLESYLAQVGNPYCFRVGKTPVKISFQPCEETLDKKIKAYFSGLKI